MPSDLMSTDQFIKDDQIQTKTVKVARISNSNNIGSRIWIIVQDTDGVLYQRWSMLMDDTDSILQLTHPGDNLEICYWTEHISDPIYQRIREDFTRNNIISVKQK